MVGPYGIRGVICERFGWTYDYLLHKIPWLDAYYMMIEAPQFIPFDDDENEGKTPTPSKVNTQVKTEPEAKENGGDKLNSFLGNFLNK